MKAKITERMQELAVQYEKYRYCMSVNSCRQDFMEGAEAMYAELAPLLEWESVKMRLPDCSPYLGKDRHGKIELFHVAEAQFIKEVGITHWRRIHS
jgi:hypothetical protein